DRGRRRGRLLSRARPHEGGHDAAPGPVRQLRVDARGRARRRRPPDDPQPSPLRPGDRDPRRRQARRPLLARPRRLPPGLAPAAADAVERVDAPMSTEDLAHVLLRFGGGGHGSAVVSQVSAGRKNSLRFEIDGSLGALAWDAERPEELWLGHRGRPNETLLRNPALLEPEAAARTTLPAGHAEGFADTFKELYRAVYTAA